MSGMHGAGGYNVNGGVLPFPNFSPFNCISLHKLMCKWVYGHLCMQYKVEAFWVTSTDEYEM